MRKIREKDLVVNKEGLIGLVEQDNGDELDTMYMVSFPDYFNWHEESELVLFEVSEQEYEKYVKSIKGITPIELYSAPLNDLYIPIPTHKEFLVIWKQFKDMAKIEGFNQELLSSDSSEGLDWDKYFYSHHYQKMGQTLLEYCINCSFPDVHCSSHPEVTMFGMSAFQLEPEMEFHDENAGILRRVTEVEVLHFSGVRTTDHLVEELSEMLTSGGFLKIMVACPEGDEEAWEYKHLFKKEIASWHEVNDEEELVEYILLIPMVENNDILWEYLVLNSKGEEIYTEVIS